MIDARLTLRRGTAATDVELGEYLDAPAEERAHDAEHAWIKRLRHLAVDGSSFRDRFTARGDSLWWFTEIYLHKQRTVLDIHRAIFALGNLFDRESPAEVSAVHSSSPIVAHVTAAFASARGVRAPGPVRPVIWLKRLAALDGRARTLTLSALATRDRWRKARDGGSSAAVAAFVHRAFWRPGLDDGAAESYVGPVLAELERRVGADSIRYVGVGPPKNFRTHRRLRLESAGSSAVEPIERFASAGALAESRSVWRARYANFRTLTGADSLRQAARIQEVDCWPLVREELAGVAWLQWPWSVRAMDEAAAALDALRPRAVVTYAEAGGWGRAIVLEARRRGIASVGLQHGFIYRHWLNYRHAPDEMRPSGTPGFPLPTKTLLFDDYAARCLVESGSFPPAALVVTGSPGLDQLAADVAALGEADIQRVRRAFGAEPSHQIVLVATKEREARKSLPQFLDAADGLPDVLVVIKPHPAEAPASYGEYARGRGRVRIASSDSRLAELLGAARAVVTVNSTVALDAGALGIPALAIGLPNNLSPFVDAGALAGAPDAAGLPGRLRAILYDERFRQQLAAGREAVWGPPRRPHGSAARSAEAVLKSIRPGRGEAEPGG